MLRVGPSIEYIDWSQPGTATGESVQVAFVDQSYTGEKLGAAAREHAIELEVVKLPEAKRGFVPLPRRWVVERSFAFDWYEWF